MQCTVHILFPKYLDCTLSIANAVLKWCNLLYGSRKQLNQLLTCLLLILLFNWNTKQQKQNYQNAFFKIARQNPSMKHSIFFDILCVHNLTLYCSNMKILFCLNEKKIRLKFQKQILRNYTSLSISFMIFSIVYKCLQLISRMF